MQIHLIHVEGFGPLYKRDIGPFSPRVNVVIGPNEAGKSALRAFIRTVLLGFPRAGTLEDRNFGYPPVDGVAHGGAIEFLKSDGLVFAVERNRRSRGPYTGVVRVTVGQESGGEEMLSELLPHLGGRVYQNVFSLSLDELQGLDSEVQERIWSAGFGSTGVIINEVRNRLAREQAEVGKLLNEEKRHLTEAVRAHAEARAELARYSELSEEVRKLEKQKYEISTQIGERRGRLARLELLKVTRPALDQMNEIQRAMTTLPRLNGVSNPARIQDEYDRERKRREQLESDSLKANSRAATSRRSCVPAGSSNLPGRWTSSSSRSSPPACLTVRRSTRTPSATARSCSGSSRPRRMRCGSRWPSLALRLMSTESPGSMPRCHRVSASTVSTGVSVKQNEMSKTRSAERPKRPGGSATRVRRLFLPKLG